MAYRKPIQRKGHISGSMIAQLLGGGGGAAGAIPEPTQDNLDLDAGPYPEGYDPTFGGTRKLDSGGKKLYLGEMTRQAENAAKLEYLKQELGLKSQLGLDEQAQLAAAKQAEKDRTNMALGIALNRAGRGREFFPEVTPDQSINPRQLGETFSMLTGQNLEQGGGLSALNLAREKGATADFNATKSRFAQQGLEQRGGIENESAYIDAVRNLRIAEVLKGQAATEDYAGSLRYGAKGKAEDAGNIKVGDTLFGRDKIYRGDRTQTTEVPGVLQQNPFKQVDAYKSSQYFPASAEPLPQAASQDEIAQAERGVLNSGSTIPADALNSLKQEYNIVPIYDKAGRLIKFSKVPSNSPIPSPNRFNINF